MDMHETVNRWIAELVPGRSFVDVGVLWNEVNEKATVAYDAGASAVAAYYDIESWQRFDARCRDHQIDPNKIAHISANIDRADLRNFIALCYDVVYCSGVVSHCPNPIWTLTKLRRLSKRDVLIGTTIIPERAEYGDLLFVPALTPRQRAVQAAWWDRVHAKVHGLHTVPAKWRAEDYAPWWWLFTPSTMRAMLQAAGLTIVDEVTGWDDHAMVFRCHV